MNSTDNCLSDNTTAWTWISELRFWTEIVCLIALIFLVILGNCLVLLALMIDRQLRNPTHYYICSLALADLALGIFVLPFAAVFQIRGAWIFGSIFCEIWLAIDVWLCTASIYSLIAVTFDRYIAVMKPLTYKSTMTHRRACILIISVWTVSLIICLPAFAVSLNRTDSSRASSQCTQMTHSSFYIAYSSTGSFYLPMIVILYLYARIYATVRRIRLNGSSGVVRTGSEKRKPKWRRKKREHTTLIEKGRQLSAVLRVHKGGYKDPTRKMSSTRALVGRLSAGFRTNKQLDVAEQKSPIESRPTSAEISEQAKPQLNCAARRFLTASALSSNANSPRSSISGETRRTSGSSAQLVHDLWLHIAAPAQLTTMWCQRIVAFQKYQKKFSLELRALKTVGIVTGCFFLSWLGFCVVYTMQAFPECKSNTPIDSWLMNSSIHSCVPDWVINLMVWLGYVNSAINPIIYGISNQQFRRTFRRILRCGFSRYSQSRGD